MTGGYQLVRRMLVQRPMKHMDVDGVRIQIEELPHGMRLRIDCGDELMFDPRFALRVSAGLKAGAFVIDAGRLWLQTYMYRPFDADDEVIRYLARAATAARVPAAPPSPRAATCFSHMFD